MNIQALKLELVQELVNTSDASVLAKVKRLLELIRAKQPSSPTDHDDELIAAAAVFGESAYGDEEPDISHLVLKDFNPDYGDEGR